MQAWTSAVNSMFQNPVDEREIVQTISYINELMDIGKTFPDTEINTITKRRLELLKFICDWRHNALVVERTEKNIQAMLQNFQRYPQLAQLEYLAPEIEFFRNCISIIQNIENVYNEQILPLVESNFVGPKVPATTLNYLYQQIQQLQQSAVKLDNAQSVFQVANLIEKRKTWETKVSQVWSGVGEILPPEMENEAQILLHEGNDMPVELPMLGKVRIRIAIHVQSKQFNQLFSDCTTDSHIISRIASFSLNDIQKLLSYTESLSEEEKKSNRSQKNLLILSLLSHMAEDTIRRQQIAQQLLNAPSIRSQKYYLSLQEFMTDNRPHCWLKEDAELKNLYLAFEWRKKVVAFLTDCTQKMSINQSDILISNAITSLTTLVENSSVYGIGFKEKIASRVPEVGIFLKNMRKAIQLLQEYTKTKSSEVWDVVQKYLNPNPRNTDPYTEIATGAWNSSLVHSFVDVEWHGEWSVAQIVKYDAKRKLHLLIYDEGSPEVMRFRPNGVCTDPEEQVISEWQYSHEAFELQNNSWKEEAFKLLNTINLEPSPTHANRSGGISPSATRLNSSTITLVNDVNSMTRAEIAKFKLKIVNQFVEFKWEDWVLAVVVEYSIRSGIHKVMYSDMSTESLIINPDGTSLSPSDLSEGFNWRPSNDSFVYERSGNDTNDDAVRDNDSSMINTVQVPKLQKKPSPAKKQFMKPNSIQPKKPIVPKLKKKVGLTEAQKDALRKKESGEMPLEEWSVNRLKCLLKTYESSIEQRNKKVAVKGISNRQRVENFFLDLLVQKTLEFDPDTGTELGHDKEKAKSLASTKTKLDDIELRNGLLPIAKQLEKALYSVHSFESQSLSEAKAKEVRKQYLLQSRTLKSNLERNGMLRARLLSKEIDMLTLCKMSAQEMASDITKSKRQKVRQEFEQDKVIRVSAAAKTSPPVQPGITPKVAKRKATESDEVDSKKTKLQHNEIKPRKDTKVSEDVKDSKINTTIATESTNTTEDIMNEASKIAELSENEEELPAVGAYESEGDEEDLPTVGAFGEEEITETDAPVPKQEKIKVIQWQGTFRGVPKFNFHVDLTYVNDSMLCGGKLTQYIPAEKIFELLPKVVDLRGKIRYDRANKFLNTVNSSMSARQMFVASLRFSDQVNEDKQQALNYCAELKKMARAGVIDEKKILIYLYPTKTAPDYIEKFATTDSLLTVVLIVKVSDFKSEFGDDLPSISR